MKSIVLILGCFYMNAMHVKGNAGQTTHAACWCGPTDIIFVLRTPALSTDFDKVKQFVRNFVDMCEVGPNKARFGLLTFADNVSEVFHIGEYNDKRSVMAAVNNTRYLQGGTRTDLALRYARTVGFNGSAISHAAKILILITDDSLLNQTQVTLSEAAQLHTEDVTVFAIGAGGLVNEQELLQIASDPSNMFTVPNFDGLHKKQVQLRQHVCDTSCLPRPTFQTTTSVAGPTHKTVTSAAGPTSQTVTSSSGIITHGPYVMTHGQQPTTVTSVRSRIEQGLSNAVGLTKQDDKLHLMVCIGVGSLLVGIMLVVVVQRICENKEKRKTANGTQLGLV